MDDVSSTLFTSREAVVGLTCARRNVAALAGSLDVKRGKRSGGERGDVGNRDVEAEVAGSGKGGIGEESSCLRKLEECEKVDRKGGEGRATYKVGGARSARRVGRAAGSPENSDWEPKTR